MKSNAFRVELMIYTGELGSSSEGGRKSGHEGQLSVGHTENCDYFILILQKIMSINSYYSEEDTVQPKWMRYGAEIPYHHHL